MKAETQQVLQTTYDLFYGSGGNWPVLGDVQRELNRRNSRSLDAARIVRRIPATLLKPLRSADGYPSPTERLVLTVEGIARCVGSGEDIENFLTAVRWLAKRAARSNTTGQGERGIRYTTQQLADAVSLSLEADPKAVNRLIAILQAEGWARDGDSTPVRLRARLLRALGYLALPWHQAAFGLFEDQGTPAAAGYRGRRQLTARLEATLALPDVG